MNVTEIQEKASLKFNSIAITLDELDQIGVNSFNIHTLVPGQVVVFGDEIAPGRISQRTAPNKDDYAMAEKHKTFVAKMDEKVANEGYTMTNEEEEEYKYAKEHLTPESCIPTSVYIFGIDPATEEIVPVLVSYLNRMGKKSLEESRMSPVDGLSTLCSKAANARLRAEKLKNMTIKVADEPETFFMQKFRSTPNDLEERKIILIDVVKDEAAA